MYNIKNAHDTLKIDFPIEMSTALPINVKIVFEMIISEAQGQILKLTGVDLSMQSFSL